MTFNIFDWLSGNNQAQMNQNPMGPNLLPQLPLNNKPVNPLASMMMPGMNLGVKNPGAIPAYAMPGMQGQNAQPNPAMNGINQSGMAGSKNPEMDLRKMMIMQALMGEEDPQIQGPNGAMPSGAGMKGSGGFQNDPNAGLLNSFPPQMQPRRRFIGMGG